MADLPSCTGTAITEDGIVHAKGAAATVYFRDIKPTR